MKLLKIVLSACFSILLLSNCSDKFLDIYPVDRKTEATFFKTQEEVYQTLVGCYQGMNRWLNNGGNWVYPIVSDIMSDDAAGGAGKSDYLLPQALDRFDPGIAPAEANIYSAMWADAFTTINRCNTFLKKIDEFPWDDNSAYAMGKYMSKAASEGEVRFIRAYIYFCSMQMWGHLPLITETTEDAGLEAQSDPKLIYELIVNDLKKAIGLLQPSFPGDASGRVTKYAAEGLLARVYLFYTGYYGKTQAELPRVNKGELLTYMNAVITESEVKGYLNDIIQNADHDLVDDYISLWPAGAAAAGIGYAGEYNKEVIFAIKHGYVNGTSMNWVSDMGARGYIMPPYGRGWGFDIGNKYLWDSWDPNDPRRDASLMNVNEEHNLFNDTDPYDDAEAGRDVREYQSLFLKKYLRETDDNGNEVYGSYVGNPSSMSSYTDYIVIRYADVLLMAAELGIDAQANFDKVYHRAYGSSAPAKAATLENIMEERHREFVGEAIRYWDLLRMGLEHAADAIKIDAPGIPVVNGALIYGSTNIVIKREQVMATYGLSQIPEQQISLSDGKLVQNEGWSK